MNMILDSLGWTVSIILAVLLLRAWLWYAKRQAERRRYEQGLHTLYRSFTSEADPHAVARHKVTVLYTDCNHILTRAYKGQRHSRRVMRRYGMSARRWNSAHGLLKEIGALPLGLCSREESYRRLRERTGQLREAAGIVHVLPFS